MVTGVIKSVITFGSRQISVRHTALVYKQYNTQLLVIPSWHGLLTVCEVTVRELSFVNARVYQHRNRQQSNVNVAKMSPNWGRTEMCCAEIICFQNKTMPNCVAPNVISTHPEYALKHFHSQKQWFEYFSEGRRFNFCSWKCCEEKRTVRNLSRLCFKPLWSAKRLVPALFEALL